MPIYLNETLKNKNMTAVFQAVADKKCETRSDIAASTGLSIVTAGKAAEAFLDCGIFIQKESQKKSVGRRAGMIKIAQDKYFVILDITSEDYNVSCYDLSLNCVYDYSYEYIDDITYKDNLCSFLHKVKSQMINEKEKRFLAICLIVPGKYDKLTDKVLSCDNHDLSMIKLREYIKLSVGIPVDIIVENIYAGVKYCQTVCGENENVLYVRIDNNGDMRARVICNRKVFKDTSETYFKTETNHPEPAIAHLIANVCMILNIKSVYIENNNLTGSRGHKTIQDILNNSDNVKQLCKLNISTCGHVPYSHMGGAYLLRNIWLNHIMK